MKPSTFSSSFDLFSSSMGTRPAALSFATGVTGSGGVRTRPSSFTSVALVAIYGLHPGNDLQCGRSEERRVGTEGVSTCRSRWWPYHLKKKQKRKQKKRA